MARLMHILKSIWRNEIFSVVRDSQSFNLQSSRVKRTPQNYINELIIRKLSPLAVVDFRFISSFLHA